MAMKKLKFFQACKVFHTLHTIAKNKKGIFFTFIAILIMMVLMILFKPKTELSFNKDIPAVKTRVTEIDNFITDFENVYLQNIIESTSYKALTSLTYYMDATDAFLEDLKPAFNEVLFNGTIGNNPIDDITGEEIMGNSTLINWTDRIKAIAKDSLNADLNYIITNVDIYQTTPWFVDIELIISYSLSSETANWTRDNVLIKTKLGIEDLYDPLYYTNTDGNYKKKINQTNIKFDEWNKENLSLFIKEDGYFHWQNSNAPNFLMRFTNTFSSSPCCGIESAVNPNKIVPSDQLQIYLDYLFFNPNNGPYPCPRETALYTINGISDSEFPGFKLNLPNVVKYNVRDEAVEITCS